MAKFLRALELKIPPLLLFALTGLIMWLVSIMTAGIGLGGQVRAVVVFCLLLIGAGFTVSGVISFKMANTTVNPLEPDQSTSLVVTGIYRFTRNPMYIGFFIWLIAWFFYLDNFYSLITALLFVPYMNQFQIKPEEKALEALFGESYHTYKTRVCRWL